MVECVEELGPELQRLTFGEPEILENRNIEVELGWSKNDALARIPEECRAIRGIGSNDTGAERIYIEVTRAAVATSEALVDAAWRGDVAIGLARTHLRADDSEAARSISTADGGIGDC